MMSGERRLVKGDPDTCIISTINEELPLGGNQRYESYRKNCSKMQDSESESATLLSSGSCASRADPFILDSETSDVDSNPRESCSKYGSFTTANNPVISVLPRRLPPLAQENLMIPNTANDTSSLLFAHKCYDFPSNIELQLLKHESHQTSAAPVSTMKFANVFQQLPRGPHVDAEVIRDTLPKQSSLVTIFSIWNTILGASLLTMPWGIVMAGLIPGLILMLTMSSLCLYTAYRILQVHQYHGGDTRTEMPELCRALLGPFAGFVAQIFSIMVLLGANITYWILMTNFLYHSVNFIYDKISHGSIPSSAGNITNFSEVLCPSQEIHFNASAILVERSVFDLGPGWDLYKTVPLFLGIIMFPLLNFNSTTFFTKFNSLGTAAIVYLIALVIYKSSQWGINMDGYPWETSWIFKTTFPALCGMLALAFFIHNIIITIMQHNRNQSNNNRDLMIAYVLVTLTYLTVSTIFYITFPLAKSCIEDNFLNNFQKQDVLTVGARIFLFFQLLTVYPLIAYMLRIRLLTLVCPTRRSTSQLSVVFVNLFVVVICVLFATFFPYVGTVIRYTGAMSGLVYVFTLPSLLHLALLCRKGEASVLSVTLHLIIPLVGVVNLVAQLFISS